MSSDLRTPDNYPTRRNTEPELRLKMKPSAAVRGSVDGGWWPRSTDPVVEFPALIMALSSWVGPARRLAYHPDDWQPVANTLTVEDWTVHLEALHTVRANTVELTGPNLASLCVLVVPPATPGGVARAVLRSASSSDTVATVEDILSSNGIPGKSDATCQG
nr:DUF5994 family protein [Kibdelosporangium sp. MJ126-NF4]CEL20833.1 hypothetical protein [Kibdelosporangium sp. MJ126-NF4]CTQ98362.1 hypothetical protein [Kibdelosporangium sp. MJ126-NF4]